MSSRKYTLEDLIVDQEFISWVKSPRDEDGRIWEQWAAESPDNKAVLMEAKEIILGFSIDEDEPLQQDLTEVWNRIEATNRVFDEGLKIKRTKDGFFNLISSWNRVAAVVAGILVLSVAAFFLLTQDQEHRTDFAQNKKVVLPDGSEVILNANSTISYSKSWDEETPREVWLEGEAYFSVTHKKNAQKFVVHTHDLDVQVIGTKFDVNTRRGKTRVILNSGKVKLFLVKAQNKEIDMKPGELVNFSPKTKFVEKVKVSPVQYSSWVEQKLVFEETPLSEIAYLLEDNYGYKVNFMSPGLSTLSFTGTVDSGNVDLLLAIFQKTFDISITKKEDQIYIDKPH